MIKVSSDADRVVVAKVQECGQGHLFDLWNSFSAEDQKSLLAQLRALDLSSFNDLLQSYRKGAMKTLKEKVRQPSEYVEIPRTQAQKKKWKEARELGEQALRDGKVALLMAAGGLGSRLGVSGPKGNLPIGPVSGKSLYCMHAEKIKALTRRYRAALPLFIITSPQTHEQTVETFQENKFFGLNRQDVKFLMQEAVPVADRRGRIIFNEPGKISMRPNGHGAALMLMLEEKNFHNLELRNIEHLYYFQVDNPLVRIADPAFVGLHILGRHEMSCKTVLKTEPSEKIGIFCQCNGIVTVVEYSELSQQDQELRLDDGRLAFSAGNVAIHLFSLDFLDRIRQENLTLPYHAVEKVTAHINREGSKIAPEGPNSIAFERFIFDALSWSKSTLIVETARTEEFAPVKNLHGTDSTESARNALCNLYLTWLKEAGAQLPVSIDTDRSSPSDNHEPIPIEVSPLFALDEEELKEKIEPPLEITPNLYLE